MYLVLRFEFICGPLLLLCTSDRRVKQRDQEVHQEHVQDAHHSEFVTEQAQEAAAAQDERTTDTQNRPIVQPAVSAAGQLQQPPVHDPPGPVQQPAGSSVRAAGFDQVHTLAGSLAQSACRAA